MLSDGAIVAICAAIPPTLLALANLVQIVKIRTTTRQIHNATNGGLKEQKDKLTAANKELDETYTRIRILEAEAKSRKEQERDTIGT